MVGALGNCVLHGLLRAPGSSEKLQRHRRPPPDPRNGTGPRRSRAPRTVSAAASWLAKPPAPCVTGHRTVDAQAAAGLGGWLVGCWGPQRRCQGAKVRKGCHLIHGLHDHVCFVVTHTTSYPRFTRGYLSILFSIFCANPRTPDQSFYMETHWTRT